MKLPVSLADLSYLAVYIGVAVYLVGHRYRGGRYSALLPGLPREYAVVDTMAQVGTSLRSIAPGLGTFLIAMIFVIRSASPISVESWPHEGWLLLAFLIEALTLLLISFNDRVVNYMANGLGFAFTRKNDGWFLYLLFPIIGMLDGYACALTLRLVLFSGAAHPTIALALGVLPTLYAFVVIPNMIGLFDGMLIFNDRDYYLAFVEVSTKCGKSMSGHFAASSDHFCYLLTPNPVALPHDSIDYMCTRRRAGSQKSSSEESDQADVA